MQDGFHIRMFFMRKIMYPLVCHGCGSEYLRDIQQPVDWEILHILRLNEHFPRAALYAPLKYGGMGCTTNLYITCGREVTFRKLSIRQ